MFRFDNYKCFIVLATVDSSMCLIKCIFSQVYLVTNSVVRVRDDCVLKKNYARTDIIKFSFFNRVVDMWNV